MSRKHFLILQHSFVQKLLRVRSAHFATTVLLQKNFSREKLPFQNAQQKKPVERIHTGKTYPDRIYRGRILKAVRENITVKDWHTLGDEIDPTYNTEKDEGWLEAMIGRLVDDGLLARKGTALRLPE